MRKVAHVRVSGEEAEAMIEFADNDGDGLVSFEDFVRVVTLAQEGAISGKHFVDQEIDSDTDSHQFKDDYI